MLFTEDKYRFMFAALQEAELALEEGEVPVGAVIVHKDRIIGRGRNQVELLKDPTAHAEIIALSAAGNHLKDWRMNECEIYVTLEPCIMCTGALLAARIDTLYFAAYDPKYGACGSLYNLAEEGKYNHKIKIFSGIYSSESAQLLKSFFGNIRS
jgi:tRNA(adenine34) deaminase